MNKQNIIFISKNINPYYNLTLGTYLANQFKKLESNKKILFLSSSHHGVFIGRNQNCWKECHIQKMKEDNVPLIRRDTGGGACYVDKGNLLFSFIENFNQTNFKKNYPIITRALKSLNFDALESGRNDICIDGKKVSGSAYSLQNNVFKHHGTILINANKDKMLRYLNPNKLKLQSKGINSVEARVANLVDFDKSINQEKVSDAIIQSFTDFHQEKPLLLNSDDYRIDDRKLFDEIYSRYQNEYY